MSDTPPTRSDLGIPDWEDPYLDRVADRLMHGYDLERDRTVGDESFDLYGEMRIESQKQLFHPALNYANHGSWEYLCCRRVDRVTTADLDRWVAFGNDLAEDLADPDEEHFSTDVTVALVAPSIPEDVREYVSGFKERTLLKFGYYGHYEVNLVVVAPEDETCVASESADVAQAFALWGPVDTAPTGVLHRLVGRLTR